MSERMVTPAVAIVLYGPIPENGYAISGYELYRNGVQAGRVEHYEFNPSGTTTIVYEPYAGGPLERGADGLLGTVHASAGKQGPS